MRIGLVIDTFNIGGAETMVFETARLLKSGGKTPVLLHFGSKYVSDFCAKNNIESHLIPNRALYKKTALLPLFALKTLGFIRRLKLDCLHSHLFGPIVAFAPLAYMARLPHAGTLHDVYMIQEAPKRIWLVKLAQLFKTQLIAVSKPMANFYQQAGQLKSNSIAYIPNFSRPNSRLVERQAVRAELGVSDNEIMVISVGRLVELKRFDVLIDAAEAMAQEVKFKVFIAGDGPKRTDLAASIDAQKHPERVTLLGERKDIERLLAAADIFTLTSETEGMSKSILEALASELPVLATDVGGNKDLVIDGFNGYLLRDHNPKNLASKLTELLSNIDLRKSMGQNSKQILEEKYNSELFLQRHIEIYSALCSC